MYNLTKKFGAIIVNVKIVYGRRGDGGNYKRERQISEVFMVLGFRYVGRVRRKF